MYVIDVYVHKCIMYVQFAICQRFTDTIVHPDLWKDPNDFIPERWLGADGVTVIPGNDKHPFAWLPFLAGERSCIGRGFAEKEYMCLLALMVWPAVCMHNCICICTSICTHSLSLSHTHTHIHQVQHAELNIAPECPPIRAKAAITQVWQSST